MAICKLCLHPITKTWSNKWLEGHFCSQNHAARFGLIMARRGSTTKAYAEVIKNREKIQ